MAPLGSALGTDFRPDSDIDLLVTFALDGGWSGWDLVTIQDKLGALFERKVDLVVRAAVERSENWIRRRHILTHAAARRAAPSSSPRLGLPAGEN